MKTLNEYRNRSRRVEIVEDQDEGGFVVSFPNPPGCITCGETVEAMVENGIVSDSANADKMTTQRLRGAIQAGLEDAEAGNVQDASSAFARFRKQHA